jgi:hypothetical protein
VALKAKEVIDRGERAPVLIFDDQTSEPIEVDFRGTPEDVAGRIKAGSPTPAPTQPAEEAPRRPGRPKLGVVAREVTLLPRHWEWLNSQPGGASVALRKLVEEARRTNAGRDRVRRAQEAAYRFMSAMAGNEAGFEEATRALFAGKPERFEELTAGWPIDVRDHSRKLAAAGLSGPLAERTRAVDKIVADEIAKVQAKPDDKVKVEQFSKEMKRILLNASFEEKGFTWKSFVNHAGHKDSPGCFRCHDGKHFNDKGEAIRLQCTLCHDLPQVKLESGKGSVASMVEAGLRVPDDVSVVGADDIYVSAFTSPPLTTIRIARDQVGQRAFEALKKLIQIKRQTGGEYVIETHLVVRESTAAPRPGAIPLATA